MSPRRTLIDLTIPPRLDSVVDARAALDRLPDPERPEGREDLELLVTELLTNAVRHAGMREDERIGLRVSESRPTLRVEVSDPGHGFVHEVASPRSGLRAGAACCWCSAWRGAGASAPTAARACGSRSRGGRVGAR